MFYVYVWQKRLLSEHFQDAEIPFLSHLSWPGFTAGNYILMPGCCMPCHSTRKTHGSTLTHPLCPMCTRPTSVSKCVCVFISTSSPTRHSSKSAISPCRQHVALLGASPWWLLLDWQLSRGLSDNFNLQLNAILCLRFSLSVHTYTEAGEWQCAVSFPLTLRHLISQLTCLLTVPCIRHHVCICQLLNAVLSRVQFGWRGESDTPDF